MDLRVILIFSAIAVFALLLLYAAGMLKKPAHVAAGAAVVAAAFLLRWFLLDHQTDDYLNFLLPWVTFFRENGGFAALSQEIGNYNIPYLYFLALFSYSDIDPLYLIKLLSIFFDVILAFASMKLAGLYFKSSWRRLSVFGAVLFLPTVVLNGAYWGQCDSIYAAFGVLSIYFALSSRPWLSMAAIAFSFAFKLQAVFIMPVFLILLIMKRVRIRNFAAFPVTYLLIILPAVLLGRPFWDTLTLYFSQTGSIGSGLNYNSSSIFSILTNLPDDGSASNLAILAAFGALLALFAYCLLRAKKGRFDSKKALLAVTALITILVPFLLPHMHDRYFFAADIFSLILAFAEPGLFAVPLLVQFGSLLGYHAYLKMQYFLPMRYGGWAMLLAIVITLIYYLYTSKNNRLNPNG